VQCPAWRVWGLLIFTRIFGGHPGVHGMHIFRANGLGEKCAPLGFPSPERA
jgi:hypothetical protein